MPDLQQLVLFVAAGWLLNLTPGPDVLYIVSNSLRAGARAGVVAGLGVTAGCFVHVFAAALGVGALLAMSATAFTVLKWAGAAYLCWIGIRLLISSVGRRRSVRSTRTPPVAPAGCARLGALRHSPTTMKAVFTGGFLTNVLNPKVAIFFLAFVPQFIPAEAEHKALVFVALGTLFNINSIPVNGGWALAAAWMAGRPSVQHGMHWLDRAAGVMFLAFGARLALTENPIPSP